MNLFFRLMLILVTIAVVMKPSHSAASVNLVNPANTAPVRAAIESFLQTQIVGLPGQASFKLGPINASYRGEQCSQLDVGMAAGARPWGKTYVSVRCLSDAGSKWSFYVPVQIQVMSHYLISARSISAGQTLGEGDFQLMQGDLAELPTGVMTDSSQALGKISTLTLPQGRPIRSDMLRQPNLIQQGQSVKILTTGVGFQATNEGRALNNAALGQVAQVRLTSGMVVSGLARSDGAVDVRF